MRRLPVIAGLTTDGALPPPPPSPQAASKGYGWLLEVDDDDEDDTKPLLEELDINLVTHRAAGSTITPGLSYPRSGGGLTDCFFLNQQLYARDILVSLSLTCTPHKVWRFAWFCAGFFSFSGRL